MFASIKGTPDRMSRPAILVCAPRVTQSGRLPVFGELVGHGTEAVWSKAAVRVWGAAPNATPAPPATFPIPRAEVLV